MLAEIFISYEISAINKCWHSSSWHQSTRQIDRQATWLASSLRLTGSQDMARSNSNGNRPRRGTSFNPAGLLCAGRLINRPTNTNTNKNLYSDVIHKKNESEALFGPLGGKQVSLKFIFKSTVVNRGSDASMKTVPNSGCCYSKRTRRSYSVSSRL